MKGSPRLASNRKKPELCGLAYTEAALTYLESLPSTKLQRQVKNKISLLAENPAPEGCKKLNGILDGKNPVYRLRSGDYRILYVVRDKTVVILDIDHRKDVYR